MIPMRTYKSIRALRRGETVEIDGLHLAIDGDGEVQAGDLYIAERNTGPQLLTAKRIDNVHNEIVWGGPWVLPTTFAYAYDLDECVKVKEADMD